MRLAVAATALVLALWSVAPIQSQGGAPGPEAFPAFVEIAAGPFVMGADPARDPRAFDNERWPDATGEGTVDLPAFYLAKHEVSVAQFSAFARETSWVIDPQALAGQPAHPVTFVSWPNALAYARWLEGAVAKSPAAPAALKELIRTGWHVALPTEAQWEKAARGGDRRAYPWGDTPRRDLANYESRGTTPAGQFTCPECAYGLSDMSGNVWEWTSSAYRPYPYHDANNRTNLDADALWVMRGGHYGDSARQLRTTMRGAADPGARRAFIGFRVALSRPDAKTK